MSNKPLELLFDDVDVGPAPPSQATKLRALDRLDRAETLKRIHAIGPVILALSSAVAVALAVTVWSRQR